MEIFSFLNLSKESTKPTSIFLLIDDHAEDGGPGEVWVLCSFYHEPLCSWIKINVNKFAISSHTALKLGSQSLRSYLKVTCEHEVHILPNTKLVPQRIMVKTTWRSDHPWSAIFCVIVYCCNLVILKACSFSTTIVNTKVNTKVKFITWPIILF